MILQEARGKESWRRESISFVYRQVNAEIHVHRWPERWWQGGDFPWESPKKNHENNQGVALPMTDTSKRGVWMFRKVLLEGGIGGGATGGVKTVVF